MLQPAKVATPATALLGFAVQERIAPAGVVNVRATGAVLEVAVLPPASRTITTGCVAKTTPLVESEGLVVKARVLAGPGVMVKLVLIPAVSVPEDAVKV